jgi:protein-disulfide isomerase
MAKKQPRSKQARKPSTGLLRQLRRPPVLLGIAVVGAIAVFAALVLVSIATQEDRGVRERLEGISAQGRTLGNATAPVTIVEFADFQCSHCRDFTETTAKEIEEQYIAQDQVRLEFRNLALLGEESILAAEAALCAEDQDKFWAYHDLLFAEQGTPNTGAFDIDNLKEFAGELGLDQTVFDQCLDSGEQGQVVADETEAAQNEGADGTPFFVIVSGDATSGETLQGARPFSDFEQIIDEQLAEVAVSP